MSIFCTTFTSLAIYSAVFGFTIGAYVGLTSVILVDLLGLDHLTNGKRSTFSNQGFPIRLTQKCFLIFFIAFGLLLLFQGIASLVGPPVAGALFDSLGSYGPGFVLGGVMITASGAMLFAIPFMQKRINKKILATTAPVSA